MSESRYKYAVKLISVNEGRHKELHEYLKSHLMPKKGIDHFEALFKTVDSGEMATVHETNSLSDARHVARSIHMHGGVPDILDT